MTTSVPKLQFTSAGIIAPSTSAILAGVQADINQAFGGGLNPGLSTPQGQLASSLAAIIADCYAAFMNLAQQVDPLYATGRMQDAIADIYLLTRYPGLPTTVTAQCIGAVGIVIPVGAQATATNGNIYICTQAAKIPTSGSVFTQFECAVSGPIACPAGALNKIYQAIHGWDSVINSTAGVLGQNTETRAEFAYRMTQSVFVNASGSVQAVYAALFNVPDIIDAYVTENTGSTPLYIGQQTLAPHSLWVCTSGGSAAAIAQAIWSKKSPGCSYNGNTPTVVYDTNYNAPYPQYTVNWWTATATPILFSIVLANSPFLPSNVAALVQAAIIGAFAGADGGTVARIGSTLYASRYYAPVLATSTPGTDIEILSLKIGTAVANSSFVVMGIDQVPIISAANISVTFI